MRALATAVFFACLSMVSTAAHAHAELIRTAPAEGAVLAAPPDAIILSFNEPVAPLALHLLGPGGTQLPLAQADVQGDTLSVPLPPRSPAGSYLFSWRIASADGHPVGGTLSFAIGVADAHAPTASPPYRAPWLYPIMALTAVALLAGLLFGIGGVAFDAWATQYESGGCRKHLPALLLAAIAVPVSLGLQGLDALAAPWSALLTRACWTAAMSTSYGLLVWIAEAAALAGLFASVAGTARRRRLLALLSTLLLGAALASSGHAATATVGNAARITVFLHVVAVASWLGALACLPIQLRAGYGETPLRRFSAAAGVIVAMLAATGLLLAWWQLRQPSDLWRTDYGRLLAGKLILVAGLLALGARNRWRWTGPTVRGDLGAMRALVRNIHWEIALAVGILCAVALWRFTPPPRALPAMATAAAHPMPGSHAAAVDRSMSMNDTRAMDPALSSAHALSGDGATLQLHGGGAQCRLIVAQKPDGHARVTLSLTRDDGAALRAREVSVTFSMAQMGIEGIVRPAHRAGQGDVADTWVVDDVPLLASGAWAVKVDALVSDFDSISLQGQGMLGPGGA
ncbi:copper resistance CopC/CopD family protein [Bordetella sp. H567]|uniref:copper resistance CopC/CopD family protein n=1 Tax=Bordetella sp. H567 TaxID=1697043 RepID=UPI00082C8605|nr:copper resistance protein CopC [Bordetella sp. H567]